MSTIKKLSHELIGLIAAGEVVDRPASAIKEMIENSIDAGATQISVEIKQGGSSYIRIVDNGSGIPTNEIRMAFERHATSKISTQNDLFAIETLGFRGEALASIAAVSKVTLTTKTSTDDFGTKIVVAGGEVGEISKAASPTGTTILVTDLFFNTPVRRKFLKSNAAESSAVADYMMRFILSNPNIAFRLISDDRKIFASVGDGKLESAILCIYGKEVYKKMRSVSGHGNGMTLEGFVGVDDLSRGNRQQQSFFLNGRYFKSSLFSSALQRACEGRVMIGRFPICVLYITLPYQNVDVNIHPNKMEVRFEGEEEIANAFIDIIKDSLHTETIAQKLYNPYEKVNQISPSAESTFSIEVTSDDGKQTIENIEKPLNKPMYNQVINETNNIFQDDNSFVVPAKSYQPLIDLESQTIPQNINSTAEQPSLINESMLNTEFTQKCVLFNNYILLEKDDTVILIDQHAAHERILYEQFLKQMSEVKISQPLLAPILIPLSARDVILIDEKKQLFELMGFEVETFDSQHIALHAIPVIFGIETDAKSLFLEVVDSMQTGKNNLTGDMMKRRVLQMACKHAIKAGDKLNDLQLQYFIETLLKSEHMPTCPHGRPIVSYITHHELDKRFKRIV